MRRRGRPRHPDILTPREWEVLALLREGLSNPDIAARLGIGREGVKSHVSEILGKLGVASRDEAALWEPSERPWWAGAAAPVSWLSRKAHVSWLATGAAGIAAVLVVAGVALLVWGLVRTDGDGEQGIAIVIGANVSLPLVLDGDRLAVSSLDGSPPMELTGPGDYTSVQYDAEGRLLYVQRAGQNPGFYRLNDDVPELVFPLPLLTGVFFATWSPDGLNGAWIEPHESIGLLRVAEPGSNPRTLGPEGLVNFRWSPDGERLLAWDNEIERATYLIDVTGSSPAVEVGSFLPIAWSSSGDVAFWEETEGVLSRRVVVTREDGTNRRVLGSAFVQVEGGSPTVTFSLDGRWLAWSSGVGELEERLGVVVAATDGANLIVPQCESNTCDQESRGSQPAWSSDGSQLAWSQDGRILVAETGIWQGTPFAEGTRPLWAPDGSAIAYVRVQDDKSTVFAKQLDAGGSEVVVVELADIRPFSGQSAWSPDGQSLVVPIQAAEQALSLSLDPKTGELEELPNPFFGIEPLHPDLAPDGSSFVFSLPETLLLVTMDGTQRTLPRAGVGASYSDWSADGTKMLFIGSTGLKTLDVDTEEVEQLMEGSVQDAVWSPDETRIAFVRDQRLGVLDIATGEAKTIVPDLNAMYQPFLFGGGHLAWSPDGQMIAFGDWRIEEPITQGRSDVYIVDADGSNLRQLTNSPRAKQHFAFSPGGKYLAYVHTLSDGGHLQIIDLDAGVLLPVDARTRTGFRPIWATSNEVIIDNPQGLVVVRPDGESRLLVADAFPCRKALIGWALGKLFFIHACTHQGA